MQLSESPFSSVNLRKRPQRFFTLLGLSVEQFDALFIRFKEQELLRQQRRHPLWSQERVGRMVVRYSSELREHLCITLFYLRQYNTQEVIATSFHLSQGQISKIITKIVPLLSQILTTPEKVAKTLVEQIAQIDQSLRESYSAAIIIDASEQPIEKNKDKTQQKADYSGKKNVTVENFKSSKLQQDSY